MFLLFRVPCYVYAMHNQKWITFIRLNKYYLYLIILPNQKCIPTLIARNAEQKELLLSLPCNLVHNSLILRYYSERATNL